LTVTPSRKYLSEVTSRVKESFGTPPAPAALAAKVRTLGPSMTRSMQRVAEAVAGELGRAFKPERIVWVSALPKTRSAKIVRRAVRAKAIGEDPGDLSSLENPESLEEIEALARA
jgi:acyl-CoA synthetase (AMP-forming)/AMP-acid ligase II